MKATFGKYSAKRIGATGQTVLLFEDGEEIGSAEWDRSAQAMVGLKGKALEIYDASYEERFGELVGRDYFSNALEDMDEQLRDFS